VNKSPGSCMNWKVIGGLAALGLGIWAFAPNLARAALPLLVLAACPLSMLLMMRAMRGQNGGSCSRQEADTEARGASAKDYSLADMKARMAALHAERDALGQEIAHREASSHVKALEPLEGPSHNGKVQADRSEGQPGTR
jgi:hypothetical protein